MSSTEEDSVPILPDDSAGSSVSSCLQDEYQELLKYAVIQPNFEPGQMPQTVAEAMRAFQDKKDDLIYPDSSVTEDASDAAGQIEAMKSFKETGAMDSTLETTRETPRRDIPAGFDRRAQQHNRNRQHFQMTPMHAFPGANNFPASPDTPESSTDSDQSSLSIPESPVVDGDVVRMEAQLDNWCLDLKRDVLAEFAQAKIGLVERHRNQLRGEKERHAKEIHGMHNEIESLKELLHTYEQSIERKNQVISNLTHAMQKQRERFEMLKKFHSWKLRHCDDRREAFASCLARKHHHHQIMSKVWSAWHSIIEAKWRQRVEKACQSKAQEVCMKLTNDYETKLASINEALESSRNEVQRLHAERDQYEETMKKAFMRGVCALNLEAMSMFHENEGNTENQAPNDNQGFAASAAEAASFTEHTAPQQCAPRTITSQAAVTASTLTHTVSGSVARKSAVPKTTSSGKGTRTITAKVTARPDTMRTGQASLSGVGLAPPMSSVLVERHHPVTQQTIGHATASRYPRQQQMQSSGSGVAQRKIAGQTSNKINLASPNIQTVKVVQ